MRRSSPSSRRTCRRITSRACRLSSKRPARRRTCPWRAGVEFEHEELDDGRRLRSGTRACVRSRRRAMPRRTTRISSRIYAGDGRAVARVHRRLAPRRRRRPARTCTPEGEPEPLARELYASIQRLLELPDGVLVCPVTTAARSAAGRSRATRSRRSASSDATTRRFATTPRRPSPRRSSSTCRRRLPTRLRSSRRTSAEPSRPERDDSARALRAAGERGAVLSPHRAERARRGDGRARTERAAARRQARLPSRLGRRHPRLRRRLRRRQGAHQPRGRRARRPDRPQAAARARLAARRCRSRC